ncbi:MAG TPA: LysR family transcriptional regulator [Rhodobacteraceae bacterium]|nr:LysR family transcriptional regulator [Paracoccaceae bacterium]
MLVKLEMFMALAREQHFGRAAESLGITQPTLSTGLKQLEETLGVQLVRRGSRYGGLTPEGQRALVWARRIVGDSRRFREEMRAAHAGLAGHLRLAVIPTALTWASRLAAGYAAQHPKVAFTILSRNSGDILAMLENFEADAGLSYLDNEPLGRVTTVPLYRERYTVLCPADHPLAARGEIGWADLAGVRLCLLTPDMQNRRIINRAFMEAGVQPVVEMESNSTVVLASHVAAGGWVTVLPGDVARFLATGQGLGVVPIRQPAPGPAVGPAVGLVALHQEVHTPVLRSLLDAAAQISVIE